MARQRKPKKLHILQGTFEKGRHADREELELPLGVPKKPEYLDKLASKEWDRIVPILYEAGVLSEADSTVLAVYCELCSEFQSSRPLRSAFPASKFAALRSAYSDLGLSPAARTRISSAGKRDGKKNPFAPTGEKKGRAS